MMKERDDDYHNHDYYFDEEEEDYDVCDDNENDWNKYCWCRW